MFKFKNLARLTAVLCCTLLLLACGGGVGGGMALAEEKSNKEKLLNMGAELIPGTVLDVGAYNFFIELEDGTEINIHTDSKLTQFYPENERLVVGDNVNVVVVGGESASGVIDRRLAFFIEFNEKAPRDFLTGTTDCVHLMVTRGLRTCFLPEYNKTIAVEGLNLDSPPSFGQRINVRLSAIPARVGNGYVYIARPQ